jgi:FkbM family methyltransferase
MLDIGANIGTTSIPRVVLGDFQYVYAAEPEPANYLCLVQNIVANGLEGFVLPDRVAIGSADTDVALGRSPRIGGHRVAPVSDLDEAARGFVDTITVRSRTLDTWIESLHIDPALIGFIKCDVQGWEPQVLLGAERTLGHRHIAWEMEISPKHLREAGSSLTELCRIIAARFDRFIDNRGEGPRDRPTSELEASLGYLGQRRSYTDVLIYNT